MRGKVTTIGCPKLDDVDYSEKLAAVIRDNEIHGVTIVRMEVPCCGGLQRAAQNAQKKPFIDVAGRCDLTLDGVIHDTICVMDFEMYEEGTISEQYLDREGQAVLWRRFIRDDWTIGRYGKKWSELLSGNEQITGNGQRCVRWYDCLCIRFGM